jgi:adenylate cyclase
MTTRRLAAILAADVVGFSTMMEKDEEGTLRRLKALQRDVIEPKVKERGGRLVKTTGDGFLCEFGSPVEAVRCAVEVQEANKANRNPDLLLRMGVNLGDIIVEPDGDIYGEGVNVAARLEQLAEPGSIWLSEEIHRHVSGKIDRFFQERGEQQVKNIARPVRVYAISDATRPVSQPKPLPLPDKPSIAVLPFANMSGDPEQEYFADGLVEDIITALSRFKALFVIARNSSFTYKGKPVDARQVGRDLGVRYVLEGSVRKSGNRLRITGQLIEAESAAHIWADKYDGALKDVFELHDAITTSVVAAIEPALVQSEQLRSKAKPTENMTAYDFYLQALAASHLYRQEEVNRALVFLEKAVNLDPDYAAAYALAANCRGRRLFQSWGDDPDLEAAVGAREARLALEKGSDDPEVLARCGWALAIFGAEIGECSSLTKRAIGLNPNSATTVGYGGWVANYAGDYLSAIDSFTRALRFSPRDPLFGNFACGLAAAHFFLNQFDVAAQYAREAITRTPYFSTAYRFLAASLICLEREAEASVTIRQLLTLFPRARVTLPSQAFARNPDAALLSAALRKAGLPE